MINQFDDHYNGESIYHTWYYYNENDELIIMNFLIAYKDKNMVLEYYNYHHFHNQKVAIAITRSIHFLSDGYAIKKEYSHIDRDYKYYISKEKVLHNSLNSITWFLISKEYYDNIISKKETILKRDKRK